MPDNVQEALGFAIPQGYITPVSTVVMKTNKAKHSELCGDSPLASMECVC